ncbi:MAG: hypothetical protein IPO92_23715 [Saprospiraceae bacterium]|nr:hypothetical protein [Saprospiraceae bacterium]
MKQNFRIICLSIFFLIHYYVLNAQNIFENNTDARRISPTEFGIPASPVFDLMGVTPSQVIKSNDIKDFKVDWAFKSWSLSPNIALQAQPFWEIMYNRKDIKKYQNARPFMSKLASVDVSAGTVRDQNTDRRIGFAVKLSLYKEKDPLLEKGYYVDIEKSIVEEKKAAEKELILLKKQLDTTTNLLIKPQIRRTIEGYEIDLLSLNSKRQRLINEKAQVIVGEFWNSSWVDIGFGKINSYVTDSSGSLASLRLNRSTANGIWINAGKGFGKSLLLSGLLRFHSYEEQVNFSTLDNNGIQFDTTAVASNNIMSFGANLRYGSPYFTFFVEYIYERRGLKTPLDAIKEVFITPENSSIISNSVDWNIVHPYRFNFGGDWRINKNVILNYSMQTIFDAALNLKTFLPVVSISCLMR